MRINIYLSNDKYIVEFPGSGRPYKILSELSFRRSLKYDLQLDLASIHSIMLALSSFGSHSFDLETTYNKKAG